MEPYGTPQINSSYKLYVPFSFTLSFRSVNYEWKVFKKGISTPSAWNMGISNSWDKQSNA